MDQKSEITKYASIYFTTKISFINELSQLALHMAQISSISEAGMDERIGNIF